MSKPWEMPGVPWKTEASFLSWVRSVLRSGWSRHPVKVEFIKRHREKIPNPNPRGRNETCWGMTCARCDGKFPLPVPKKTRDIVKRDFNVEIVCIEIDHKTQAGSLRSAEDIGSFAERLFYVTFADLQPLCEKCHRIITLSQKLGISEEESVVEKKVIELMKQPAGEQCHWLYTRNIVPATNAEGRRKQIREAIINEPATS